MSTTQGLEPTQTRRPWRATIRTILQVGLPAILALPLIIEVIIDELGGQLPPGATEWLVAAGAALTAISAVLARVMAIPAVELLFRRLPGAAFAAQPLPKPVADDSYYDPSTGSKILGKAVMSDPRTSNDTNGA